MNPSATVIVPALDAVETIGEQLEALRDQAGALTFEVLVVDNGSTDGTQTLVRRLATVDPRVRLVDASVRRGVNFARQVGARAASGRTLLYCDADDVVGHTWVKELNDALAVFDLVGGRIDEHLLNGAIPARYRTPRMDGLSHTDLGPRPFVAGGCLGIKREVLEAVGGWDLSYPAQLGGDDVDLSWRCALAGYRLGFVPGAVLHYRQRQGLRAASRQSYRYGAGMPVLLSRHGLQPRQPGAVLRDWSWIVGAAPRAAVDRHFRRFWAQRTAFAFGRGIGSARLRVRAF